MKHDDKLQDAEIIKMVQSGKPEMFNQLVIKYEARICRVAMGFVVDPNEAKDIAQESFISAFQGLKNFRGDSSFYTWLYRISVNTAKNYISIKDRKMMVKAGLYDEDSLLYKDSPELTEQTTPETKLHYEQAEAALFHALETLPDDLKVTLTLRELGGLSYQDIAQIMHCPVGTIRSRLHRARAHLSGNLD